MAISAANKLSIYNGALLFIDERSLSALTEAVESRRLLDSVWDRDGINTVLEHGQWNFATRGSKLEYEPAIEPDSGYNRAFEMPSDLVRLTAMCSDPFYTTPILLYDTEAGFWLTSLDEIYVKYVSNDGAYGTDYSLWPPSFKRYVEAWFGCQIIGKLTQSETKKTAKEKDCARLLVNAQSIDAMNDPTKFRPIGRFRLARSRGATRGDGGLRGRLLG